MTSNVLPVATRQILEPCFKRKKCEFWEMLDDDEFRRLCLRIGSLNSRSTLVDAKKLASIT